MSTTGKRAQELQEKRLNEREEEIRDCIDDMSRYSKWVEDSFSKIREMIRKGKKKDKYGKTLDSCKDEILKNISIIENSVVKLKSLDKSNDNISHYQQKMSNWNDNLDSLITLNSRLFGKKAINSMSSHIGTSIGNFSNDPEEIKINLTKLSSFIDSKIKSFFSRNKSIKTDIAKFDSNLAMLKSIVPDDSMISHFDSKRKEWKAKIKQAKMSRIIIIGAVILFFIIESIIAER